MVVSIQTIHSDQGCRTAITQGHRSVTIDGAFVPRSSQLRTGDFTTSYMFGT